MVPNYNVVVFIEPFIEYICPMLNCNPVYKGNKKQNPSCSLFATVNIILNIL